MPPRSRLRVPLAVVAVLVLRAAAAAETAPNDGRVVVLAAGDSITAASYPTHLQALLDAAGVAVRVVNAGVTGHTSGEYLAHLRRSGVLRGTAPDVVLLQLGTNDVRIDGDHTDTPRFYRQMGMILDLIMAQPSARGRPPVVFLATIPPVTVTVPGHFDRSSMRRVTEEINPTIRRLARERGLGLADTHELFRRHPEWLPEIHPSEEGYRGLARQWFDLVRPHVQRLAGGR